ncbi:LysE family transporter [Rhizobium sp. CECT 9324]|uniref:LysE family translocator n=1 Tax=Rhizobium sp. CECT 9324 TaxID=2845820 RepID=UPI001E4EEE4E|nr:LysE family transporter [Rhizobium sp. CECT 9324]CAH0339554.1 Threonine efflux protein [Rhizobium sp. CECT 9324]
MSLTLTATLFSILTAIAIGAMSPGPSFILVSRLSVSRSRLHGLAAAIGMGLGGALFATLALAGLTALIQQVAWLYLTLKVFGGVYLVYFGIRIWQGASQPLADVGTGAHDGRSALGCLAIAFLAQISNPKTAVVYASIFAALMPANPPTSVLLILPPAIFLVEAGWYAIVALAFSARRSQAVYLRFKMWIDRAAGAVMGVLGVRLISESLASAKN